jgi:hypothetical protein
MGMGGHDGGHPSLFFGVGRGGLCLNVLDVDAFGDQVISANAGFGGAVRRASAEGCPDPATPLP